MEKEYISKVYDKFEIRIYEGSDPTSSIGKLYMNSKPVGLKLKNRKGDIVHMESGPNTSIIKKFRNAISLFNKGNATVVTPDRLKANKFTTGDILIPKDTNVVELQDIIYIYDACSTFEENYIILFLANMEDDNSDNLEIIKTKVVKASVDSSKVSVGNDTSIGKLYDEMQGHYDSIKNLECTIEKRINEKLDMLNKTNQDFYNDLLTRIHSYDASEYEKAKYIEFVEAAYMNREESK